MQKFVSIGAILATAALASPALAKDNKPPASPPCASVSGVANFQCGAVKGDHIFLDSGKAVTSTTAEYPKANVGDNIAVTLSAAADVADGYANIKPVKNGALLTSITFTFTDPNNAVTGFLFRGQLNEHADPIVVTVTDQNDVQQVFDYTISSKSDPSDIGDIGFSQAISGERVKIVSLFTAGGWFEGKQYEVTACTADSCPNGGFGGGGGGGVPEPAAWAMMLLGVAGVGGLTRRRRAAPSLV